MPRRRPRVVVSAGPTREPLDRVRFLTSASTGRMGFAVAEACRRAGQDVVLVAGPTEVPPPRGVQVVRRQRPRQPQRPRDAQVVRRPRRR